MVKGGGDLKCFAIAGSDRKFVWAHATIEGDKVIVSSDVVPNPVAVRYAWADNPEGANLFNKQGLPASPFRTDAWTGK
jgi:sialate O-acetylesterase